jgi:chemotaxis protein CheY-P-specific phosphatase CheC
MARTRTLTVTLPSDEEFSKISEEEMEEHFELLENVENFDELVSLLEGMGINIIEDEDAGPGPNDTIH